MNLLKEAKWICCDIEENNADVNYSPLFRKSFNIHLKPKNATLLLCGLGYHYASINGEPITDIKLEPAFTAYHKRVFVSGYDITKHIQVGENVFSAELGRGFYAMNTPNVWLYDQEGWHDEPKLICLMLFLKTVKPTPC